MDNIDACGMRRLPLQLIIQAAPSFSEKTAITVKKLTTFFGNIV